MRRMNVDGTGKTVPGTNLKYTSKVDAGEGELYVFHDWQKNVFVMGDDENNNKLTSSEIKAHLKYWVMGDKESSISETKKLTLLLEKK